MPDAAPSAQPLAAPELLRVAHVRRAHGIRGEVRVQSLGGDVHRFRSGTSLLTERGQRSLTVRSARSLDGDELLLSFVGIDSREQAAGLSGDYLSVDVRQARRLGRDEWFVWQLIGLRARTAEGRELGVVADVENHPSSDVLVVRQERGEERYPMVRQWVREVDLNGGVIVLTPWPELDG